MLDFLVRKSGVDRAKVEARLSQESARIDLLRSGARRERGAPSPAKLTADGLRRDGPSLDYTTDLVGLAVARARVLADGGRTTEALDLLTDVCVAGRDWAQARLIRGHERGLAAMDLAFCEIRDLIQSPRVFGKELEDLDQTLSLLDDAFPDTSSRLWDELLNLGELLIREERDDQIYYTFSGQERVRRSWRYGFSSRLQAAAVFSAAEEFCLRELEIEKQPWTVAYQANQDLHRKMELYRDPLVSNEAFCVLEVQNAIRTRGSLRLLRVAVHYRVTGKILDLEDPAGGVIRTRPVGESTLFWKKKVTRSDGKEPTTGDKDYLHWNTVELPRR